MFNVQFRIDKTIDQIIQKWHKKITQIDGQKEDIKRKILKFKMLRFSRGIWRGCSNRGIWRGSNSNRGLRGSTGRIEIRAVIIINHY